MTQVEYIPGLPNDVSQACLLRVHYSCLFPLSFVSKLTRELVLSPQFFESWRLQNSSNGILYVFGYQFSTGEMLLDSFESFSRQWTSIDRFPLKIMSGFAILTINSNIFVVGGYTSSNQIGFGMPHPTNEVWSFNLVSRVWKKKSPMQRSRSNFAHAVFGSKIYVAGGTGGPSHSSMSNAEIYDSEVDRWTSIPDMLHPMSNCEGAAMGGKFFVFQVIPCTSAAGARGFSLYDAHFFDPAIQQWKQVDSYTSLDCFCIGTPFGNVLSVLNDVLYCVTSTSEGIQTLYFCEEEHRWIEDDSYDMCHPPIHIESVHSMNGKLYILGEFLSKQQFEGACLFESECSPSSSRQRKVWRFLCPIETSCNMPSQFYKATVVCS